MEVHVLLKNDEGSLREIALIGDPLNILLVLDAVTEVYSIHSISIKGDDKNE